MTALVLEQSLHKLNGFLTLKTLRALVNLSLYEINQNLHAVNAAQLREPHLVQMYDRYATYNGSSPYQTPGIMTLVQHLEQEYGTFVPDGGMEQICRSLFELAKTKGITFHLGQKVNQILVERGKATESKPKIKPSWQILCFPIWMFSPPTKTFLKKPNSQRGF